YRDARLLVVARIDDDGIQRVGRERRARQQALDEQDVPNGCDRSHRNRSSGLNNRAKRRKCASKTSGSFGTSKGAALRTAASAERSNAALPLERVSVTLTRCPVGTSSTSSSAPCDCAPRPAGTSSRRSPGR